MPQPRWNRELKSPPPPPPLSSPVRTGISIVATPVRHRPLAQSVPAGGLARQAGALIRRRPLLIVLLAAVLLSAAGAGVGFLSRPDPQPEQIAAPEITRWLIQYRVTATRGGDPAKGFARITMDVPGGGGEQHEVALPWESPILKFRSGEGLYLSATNQGYGSITAEILAFGIVCRKATSTGRYQTATVRARAE